MDKNLVWYYFNSTKTRDVVVCKQFNKRIKGAGGNNSDGHMKTQHKIILLKRN